MSAFVIRVPEVSFKVRKQISVSPGFEWSNLTSRDLFASRRVVVFALPGAFTPTCSSTHLPGYEAAYDEFKAHDIDEVYCLSVNDSFVMNAWLSQQSVSKVKPLPDGTGEFTRKMGFLVDKNNLGFGMRSWRYAMVVNNGVVENMWVEPGLDDNANNDPFVVSDASTVLEYVKKTPNPAAK